ncbi:MAG: BON domain-containing protein [Acidibrevibacterium sp.]|jgi:osmotically-inducible protein OsmY|uniref:BON domain-containing protein n=1 Tax=Acidibrevibacterium fodinaquatile TaxID=1969806 RepID=UPI000E0CEB6F|nr:BON domain-containing protein [Acidibrevibacterium fodinaquatile]MCA7118830.1 BON domain-containing protein [Acidibrevibacterium fodinaquatile]
MSDHRDDLVLDGLVREELEWAPHVDATNITVHVRDGIVTLGGFVASYAEKKAAERAVWHVRGVLGLAQDIEVRLNPEARHSDEEIAHRIASILRWDARIPEGRIQVKVEAGVVTLIGAVDWRYQKEDVEARVQPLAGVVAIKNEIVVRPPRGASNINDAVRRALARHAEIDASRITVVTQGGEVTLAGEVRSLAARRIAENAAWSATGVENVIDRMRVVP